MMAPSRTADSSALAKLREPRLPKAKGASGEVVVIFGIRTRADNESRPEQNMRCAPSFW